MREPKQPRNHSVSVSLNDRENGDLDSIVSFYAQELGVQFTRSNAVRHAIRVARRELEDLKQKGQP